MLIYLLNILVSGQIKQLGNLDIKLYQNREQIVTLDEYYMQFGFVKKIKVQSNICQPQDYEFELNKKFQIQIQAEQIYQQSYNTLFINDGDQIFIIKLLYEDQKSQQGGYLNQIYNYTIQSLNFSGQIIGLHEDQLYVYKEGYAYRLENQTILRFNNTLPKYKSSIITNQFILLLDEWNIYQYDFNFTQLAIYANNDYRLLNLIDVNIQQTQLSDFYLIKDQVLIKATFYQITSTFQFNQQITDKFDNISITDNGYVYTYDSQFVIHSMNSTYFNQQFQDIKSLDKYIILIGDGVNQVLYRFKQELSFPQYFNSEGLKQVQITNPDMNYQQYLIISGSELEIYQLKQRQAYLICLLNQSEQQDLKLNFIAEAEDCSIDGDIMPCQLNGTLLISEQKVYIDDALDVESLLLLILLTFAILITIYLVVHSRVKVAQIAQDRLRRQIEINRINKTEESQIPECD
ncbi:hypothetical protein pb186bvf_019781 [Paramecium bursaria]